jgi:micrococcal nuclease
VLGLVAACQRPATTDPSAPERRSTAVVTRILDGDSVLVDWDGLEVDIRLAGVNAAEEGECYHDQATDHLRGLLDGQTVGVEKVGTDQFDRTLAYLWLDDRPVNLGLVEQGFAIALTPEPDETTGASMLAAEETAYLEGAGLWSASACGATGPAPKVTVDVEFDPPGPDRASLDLERVVLTSAEPIDLDGWTVRDESSAHRCSLPSGARITQGASVVVSSADPCWVPGSTPVWNNGGDLVLLLDPTGRVVARHRYLG